MQNEEEKKSGRGGRREGAGRPATKNNTRTIALRIPQDVADILDRQPNRSAFIIEAIRAYAAASK
ncbi:MAG: ribbon-helix-helix domain-containing protein [Bacteroides sp.]|nr:ribbon-helix-helix domain-containing protein [Bacteroides sp.]MCM1379986.1 ribbon-helix-helix domain-containing protein [Bacteroides sp.]MCM1446334.1 ribbon-helix-helix domain-containing protein [Prevotella sp.]